MSKMAELHQDITERIDAQQTPVDLALLRWELEKQGRLTDEFRTRIEEHMTFLIAEAA